MVEANLQPVQLRPLRVGELLDKAFRIYRSRFTLLIAIAALVLVPLAILETIETLALGKATFTSLLSGLISLPAYLALIVAISRIYLGQQVALFEAYKIGINRFGSIYGANILINLAVVVPAMVLGICGASLGGTLFMFILIAPYAAFMMTRWGVVNMAVILEGKGATESLRRSWYLTKDHFWRVLGTSFAGTALVYLITLVPGLLFSFIARWLSISAMLVLVLDSFLSSAGQIIALPLSMAVSTLIYYDLRIRKEGFDLEYMAEQVQPPAGESA